MAEILFVTPNFKTNILEIPLGSLLLGTILRQNGMDVGFASFSQFGSVEPFEDFLRNGVEQISKEDPKIVSFYTRCDSYHIVLRLAQRLKAAMPQTWIVFGGPQADITACDTVRNFDYVDFVCCGEGETTVCPLFASLLKGQPDLDVPGLVYCKDGQPVKNPRPALMEDLDALPMVDYSLVQTVDTEGQDFPVDVGRGCPFGCTYCSTNTFWGRKYRLKSPERIAQDVKDVHDRFGFASFAFEHDMFTMKRSQVEQTCKLLKKLDFPIRWRCSARVDCIDEGLIDTMVDAGMYAIYIGIETGSARMQKKINKNLKLEHVLPMLRYIHSKGVKVTTSFIYGFPEETREDLCQTMELMRSIMALGKITVQAHLCTFLPGTELTRQYMDQLTPMTTYSNITGDVAVEDCRELIKAYPKVFLHFREYTTPMRKELRYFGQFMWLYSYRFLVYDYLTKQLGWDMYQLYLEFVRVNTPETEDYMGLARADRFPETVTDVPLHDLIKDICRLWRMEQSIKPGEISMDVFSFNPNQLRQVTDLNELARGMFILTIQSAPDGTITRTVRGRA